MPTIAVTSARLDQDNRKIRLTLATPIASDGTVGVAFTKGTVKAANGVALESFTEKPVTNKVGAGGGQVWSSFQPSPLSTSIYPYQCVVHLNSDHKDYLICSKYKLYDQPDGYVTNIRHDIVVYIYDMGEWNIYDSSALIQQFTTLSEANNDVYTDSTYAAVRFAKTTS
jgi:hypothetical protein